MKKVAPYGAHLLVEKPFGFNLNSAQALNHLLLRYFSEDQIYRIDHYAGKETVQQRRRAALVLRLLIEAWAAFGPYSRT